MLIAFAWVTFRSLALQERYILIHDTVYIHDRISSSSSSSSASFLFLKHPPRRFMSWTMNQYRSSNPSRVTSAPFFLKASTVSAQDIYMKQTHRCLSRRGPWNLEVSHGSNSTVLKKNRKPLGVSSRRAKHPKCLEKSQVRWWKMRTRKKLQKKMFWCFYWICFCVIWSADVKKLCEGKGEGKLSKSQKPGAKCMGLG